MRSKDAGLARRLHFLVYTAKTGKRQPLNSYARAVGAHGFGGVGEVVAVGGGTCRGVGDELHGLAEIVLVEKETVPNRTRR